MRQAQQSAQDALDGVEATGGAAGAAELDEEGVGIRPHRTEYARFLRLGWSGIHGRVVNHMVSVRERAVDVVQSSQREATLGREMPSACSHRRPI